MQQINLTSQITALSEYKGKSKFPFFQTLEPGDIIEISTELKSISHYAPLLTLLNLRNKKKIIGVSFNQFSNYIRNIDFETVTS